MPMRRFGSICGLLSRGVHMQKEVRYTFPAKSFETIAKEYRFMEQQLAELYNRLAKHVVSMIQVKWDAFHYLGEVEKRETELFLGVLFS